MSPIVIILALAVIQGLCEFLPVSSSGHLVLTQAFFGLKEPEILLDLVLHLGTLLAVLVFYRKSLLSLFSELRFLPGAVIHGTVLRTARERPDFKLGLFIIIGSVPTAIIGLLAQKRLEALFASVSAVGVALLITAGVLTFTAFRKSLPTKSIELMTVYDALIIGTFQGLAIAPGLSRSGLTIACALTLGLTRDLSAKYSFLLSIPAILGGLLLSVGQGQTSSLGPGYLLIGLAVSALVGYCSLRFLTYVVDRGRLALFAPWCFSVG
ncbi:MAG: undecaprenyl-diphosphate phosphatase, partial [Deltaproteobacteria bacterium]|nr:undecaprenyl-diphosphate phosphatase [Deltaproteobacteria bacterium]